MNLFLFQCFRTLVLLSIMLLSSCSAIPTASCSAIPTASCSAIPTDEDTNDSRDPLEMINRPFWTFTWDYVDKYVAKPASELYTTYTPPIFTDWLIQYGA